MLRDDTIRGTVQTLIFVRLGMVRYENTIGTITEVTLVPSLIGQKIKVHTVLDRAGRIGFAILRRSYRTFYEHFGSSNLGKDYLRIRITSRVPSTVYRNYFGSFPRWSGSECYHTNFGLRLSTNECYVWIRIQDLEEKAEDWFKVLEE